MLYAFDSSRNCVVFAYPNICKRTFKYTYNLKTGSFDSEYLYAKDVAEDYECGTEALKWIKSR